MSQWVKGLCEIMWNIFFWEEKEWNIFPHEKRNFVSPSCDVILYLLYKQQWNTKSFQKVQLFVTIATVIFSHVKRICHNFFSWKLTEKFFEKIVATNLLVGFSFWYLLKLLLTWGQKLLAKWTHSRFYGNSIFSQRISAFTW